MALPARKLPLVILTALFCLTAGTGWGADLQKGLDAYESEDYATALRELKPLAEQSDAVALFTLNMMYARGLGVLQDYEVAVELLILAAEQGYAKAQYHLGLMLGLGDGALYKMGLVYGREQGIPLDYIYAHMWLNIAASNGIGDAVEHREMIEGRITRAARAEAQQLARECVQNDYKGC